MNVHICMYFDFRNLLGGCRPQTPPPYFGGSRTPDRGLPPPTDPPLKSIITGQRPICRIWGKWQGMLAGGAFMGAPVHSEVYVSRPRRPSTEECHRCNPKRRKFSVSDRTLDPKPQNQTAPSPPTSQQIKLTCLRFANRQTWGTST